MIIRKTGKPNEVDVAKAKWQLGFYTADFRAFGHFELLADDQPPSVDCYTLKEGADMSRAEKIMVTVIDNNKELGNFRAELDGKWLLFSQKGNTFTYFFDEHCPTGRHSLRLKAEDEAGNMVEKLISFTR
jgi:hypothetical protein